MCCEEVLGVGWAVELLQGGVEGGGVAGYGADYCVDGFDLAFVDRLGGCEADNGEEGKQSHRGYLYEICSGRLFCLSKLKIPESSSKVVCQAVNDHRRSLNLITDIWQ